MASVRAWTLEEVSDRLQRQILPAAGEAATRSSMMRWTHGSRRQSIALERVVEAARLLCVPPA